jgi:hypothetical protein
MRLPDLDVACPVCSERITLPAPAVALTHPATYSITYDARALREHVDRHSLDKTAPVENG